MHHFIVAGSIEERIAASYLSPVDVAVAAAAAAEHRAPEFKPPKLGEAAAPMSSEHKKAHSKEHMQLLTLLNVAHVAPNHRHGASSNEGVP